MADLLQEYRQTRQSEIRDRIVLNYTNLVESIARRFAGAAEPAEDLAQEGYIGLITAVDLYDPDKNVKFSTYATHFIIGQIKHYLRDRGKIIKEPAWLQEINLRMTRIMDSLSQQLSRPATHLEIAQAMGITEEEVAEMLMNREVFKVSSIDGGSDTDEDTSGTVNIERQKPTDVAVSFQLSVEDKIVLEAALQKLKDLEQKVLAAFYFQHRNQTEIARQLGISCNYVSHILRDATKKLKKILVTDELRDAHRSLTHSRRRTDVPQAAPESQEIVDPLTRLYNAHYFAARLEEEMSRASREDSEMAILFLQIGGLNAFFRAYGTLKGEEAVIGVATRVRNHIRRSDIVTRYSSDTFALILPHTGHNALVVQDRLLKVLTAWLVEMDWYEGRAPLNVRIGMAVYPYEGTQAAYLASQAFDKSLPEAA